jgi:hypothetical protein
MATQEWRHLHALVDELVSTGNRLVRGFQPNQGGCDCVMEQPLDLDRLRPLIAADEHADKIKLGKDRVDCLHCWAGILGPNRRP